MPKLPTMRCPACKYVWAYRVESPKRCPRCQKRLMAVAERKVVS